MFFSSFYTCSLLSFEFLFSCVSSLLLAFKSYTLIIIFLIFLLKLLIPLSCSFVCSFRISYFLILHSPFSFLLLYFPLLLPSSFLCCLPLPFSSSFSFPFLFPSLPPWFSLIRSVSLPSSPHLLTICKPIIASYKQGGGVRSLCGGGGWGWGWGVRALG